MSAPPVLPTAGNSRLENDVLLDPTVTVEAKAMLTLLQYFDRGNGRGCFASKETLSHFANLSLFRLKNALDELVDLGKITIQRRGQGKTDIIFIVPRENQPISCEEDAPQIESPPLNSEKIDQIEDEIAQLEEIEPEIKPQLEEELPEVDPGESVEEIADLEIKSFDFQKPNISPVEHYIEENKVKNSYFTLCTKPGTIEPQDRTGTEKQCEDLISFYYVTKENRQPTKIEIHNWTSTARRLLNEFSLDELKPAVINAVTKGARLFHFVGLTAPSFIIEQRQQKQEDVEREKRASKALEAEQQRRHQSDALRRSATVYDGETKYLLNGLESRMRPQVFRTWFKDTFITKITEDTLTLAVASPRAAEWMSKSYTALIQEITDKPHIQFIAG